MEEKKECVFERTGSGISKSYRERLQAIRKLNRRHRQRQENGRFNQRGAIRSSSLLSTYNLLFCCTWEQSL
jgi:hypothetical protein